jgi:hypothetical protein
MRSPIMALGIAVPVTHTAMVASRRNRQASRTLHRNVGNAISSDALSLPSLRARCSRIFTGVIGTMNVKELLSISANVEDHSCHHSACHLLCSFLQC